MANEVQTRLTSDNAEFDAAFEKSAKVVTATGVASEKASKKAADAQKFASQFISESVSKQAGEQVAAMQRVRQAQEDFSRAQKIVRAGYLDESQGAQTLGAALQRLTAAQKAAAEASRRVGAAASESGKGMQDVAERVVLSSVGYIAAATGIRDIIDSMKEAVSSSLEFGESIHRASINTGLAAGTLSTLHYAAAVTGGDFESLTKGVERMDKQIAAATGGNKTAAAVMKALGLDAKALANSPEGAEIAFKRMAETLANTKNAIQRVDLASQMMGQRMGAEQVATLIEVGTHMDEYTQKAKDAGMYLDGPMADQLNATNERFRTMGQRIDGAKLAFTEGLNPGLNSFMTYLGGANQQMSIFNMLGVGMARVLNGAKAAALEVGSALDVTLAGVESKLGFTNAALKEYTRAGREAENASAANAAVEKRGGATAATGTAAPDTKGKGYGGTPDPEAVEKADAAARKAAQAKLKGMEAQLAEEKQQTSMSVKAEYDFWAQRIDAFKKGSDQYNTIVEKQAQLAVEGAKAAHEKLAASMKQIREVANLSPDAANRGIAENKEQMGQLADNVAKAGDRWREYNDQVAKSVQLTIRSAQAAREAQLAHDVKTGATSKSDAAQQLGMIHADAAQQEIAELRTQLARIQEQQSKLNLYTKEGAEDAPKLAAQGQGVQNQIAAATAAANLQAVKDQYAAFAETGLGGAVSALQEFTAASRDSAAQMKAVMDSIMNNVNRAIMADLTEKNYQRRGAWKDAGKGIFTDVAGSALKKGEGSVMGMFGLGGGKMGTRGNPMFVKSADVIPAGAATSAASALSSGGGLMSGLMGKMLGFLPAFADGGDFGAGTTALVGENGPEVVRFGSAGHVTPNGKTPSAAGGGDTHHTWNIDARGSTDPAQTMALVKQGIIAAAPHIVAASLKAGKDQSSRKPPGARG